jgi:hypothetical protein
MGQLNLRVLINVVANTGPLRAVRGGLAGLAKPGQAAGMVIRSLGRDLRNLGLMGAAALSAVGLGAWNLTRRVLEQGEAAVLASEKTGVSIRSVQRLGVAFEMAGVGAAELEQGLKFLNVSIDAAGRGSKQDERAFAALGVSIRDAAGDIKPTEQVLIEVADKLKEMDNGAEKTAIAMALFGRSGVDMIPGLNQGGAAIKKLGDEAEAAGAVMSEQAARDAEALGDEIDMLKKQVGGLGTSLGVALLPMLNQGVLATRQWIAENRPAVIAKVTEVVNALSTSLPPLFAAFLSIVMVLGDLAKILGPIIRAVGGFGTVLDGLAAILIGRLAIAVWAAVKAVWALNGAMYANPIGLVIAGIAALVFAGWLLIRNWGRISRAWIGFWGRMNEATAKVASAIRGAFKAMVDGIWALFPPWLKTLFRVGRYVVRVVGSGLGGQGPGAGGPGGVPPNLRPRPRPPGPGASFNAGGRLDIDVRLPNAPRVAAAPADPGMNYAVSIVRGTAGR